MEELAVATVTVPSPLISNEARAAFTLLRLPSIAIDVLPLQSLEENPVGAVRPLVEVIRTFPDDVDTNAFIGSAPETETEVPEPGIAL